MRNKRVPDEIRNKIKKEYSTSNITRNELAKKYKLSVSTIDKILAKRNKAPKEVIHNGGIRIIKEASLSQNDNEILNNRFAQFEQEKNQRQNTQKEEDEIYKKEMQDIFKFIGLNK